MPPNAGRTAAEIVFWLEHQPMSAREISEKLGLTQETVRYHLKNLLAQKLIHQYCREIVSKSYCPAVRYAAGDQRTAAQINPFLTAAGLIAAPIGKPGRVYNQFEEVQK